MNETELQKNIKKFKIGEIDTFVENNTKSDYPLSLVLKGEHGNTKHLNITIEQVIKIRAILMEG